LRLAAATHVGSPLWGCSECLGSPFKQRRLLIPRDQWQLRIWDLLCPLKCPQKCPTVETTAPGNKEFQYRRRMHLWASLHWSLGGVGKAGELITWTWQCQVQEGACCKVYTADVFSTFSQLFGEPAAEDGRITLKIDQCSPSPAATGTSTCLGREL